MSEWAIITEAAPLGTAGLIAAMWLIERRNAGDRERQLTEAHERLMAQHIQLRNLITVIADNTRAVTALEDGQRELRAALRSLAESLSDTQRSSTPTPVGNPPDRYTRGDDPPRQSA